MCFPIPCTYYRLDLTDHNSVNPISSREVSARGYCRILQSLQKHMAKEQYAKVHNCIFL